MIKALIPTAFTFLSMMVMLPIALHFAWSQFAGAWPVKGAKPDGCRAFL